MALLNERLLAIARAVEFRAGARLLHQGEAARGAFVIREGEVEAQVALPGGGTLAVARLGAGDMIGETALVERGVCMASVVAQSAVAAWFIERDDFRALMAGRDAAALELQKALTRVLSQKLRAANARLSEHRAAEDRPETPAQRGTRGTAAFDWRAFLPLLPFFQGFDADEIDALVEGCTVFELERGASLFRGGEPAQAAYLVVRGALEIVAPAPGGERRITVAGPGELAGYLAVLEERPYWTSARVRESACLIELAAPHLVRRYETMLCLQRAIHRSLLHALARTNAQLIRLISHARLNAARSEAEDLERALHSQIVLGYN